MKTAVAKVTVARLHNMGNYEHIRYEVTVDVAPGDDAGKVTKDLEKVLGRLSPRCPGGITDWDYRRAIERLAKPAITEGLDEEVKHDAELRAAAQETKDRYTEWLGMRGKALERLNNLGGSGVHTDAKDKWEDDLDY